MVKSEGLNKVSITAQQWFTYQQGIDANPTVRILADLHNHIIYPYILSLLR